MKPRSNSKHHAQLQQIEALKQQHAGYVQYLNEQVLGKLVLLGLSGQGITKVIVNDVKGECAPAIAIRASVDDTPDDGQYYDMATLKIFHIYSEDEKAEYLKEVKARNMATSEVMRPPSNLD